MNKNNIIGIGFGIMILILLVAIISPVNDNGITGMATEQEKTNMPDAPAPPKSTTPTMPDAVIPPPKIGDTGGKTITFPWHGTTYTFPDPEGDLATMYHGGDAATNELSFGGTLIHDKAGNLYSKRGNTLQIGNGVDSNGKLIVDSDITVSNGVTIKNQYTLDTTLFYFVDGTGKQLDLDLASQLTVNRDGKGLTFDGKNVDTNSFTDDGNSFTTVPDANGDTSSINIIGNTYVIKKDGTVQFSEDAAGNKLIPDLPTVNDVKCNSGGCTGTTNDFLGLDKDEMRLLFDRETGKTTIINVDENQVMEIDSGGNLDVISRDNNGNTLSRERHYKNGDHGFWDKDNLNVDNPSTRYDQDGNLRTYDASDGKTYSFDKDGKSYECDGCYSKTEVDENGKPYEQWYDRKDNKINPPGNSVTPPKDAQDTIDANRFWNGNSKFSNIGNFMQDADRIYNSLKGLGDYLGLDKWKGSQKWVTEVDKFFNQYLSIEKIITTKYCDAWIDNSNAPSSYARGRDGLPAAHIEGERSEFIDYETNKKVYIYKVTFAVNPSTIVNADQMLEFRVYYEPGRKPLFLTQGIEGTDVVKIKGNSKEFRVDGSNMIVRPSNNYYEKICLDFEASAGILDQTFATDLSRGGQRYSLCNQVGYTDEGGVPGNSYLSVSDFITGRWNTGSGDGSNGDNSGGRDNNEQTPPTSNTGALD